MTAQTKTQVKMISKKYGVKGFRKFNLKRELHIVGKQCQRIESAVALKFIAEIESIGCIIAMREIVIENASVGLFDTLTIEG